MAPAWLSVLPASSTCLLLPDQPTGHVIPAVLRRGRTTIAVATAAAPPRRRLLVAVAAATKAAPAASGEEEEWGKKKKTTFVEEMRAAAIRLHSRDQTRHGEKEVPLEPPVATWAPTVAGFVRFLADNKLVFQTLEAIVGGADVPWYAEFRNTGLERSEALEKDLEWFKQQGYTIPEPSAVAVAYASFLEELSEKEPQIAEMTNLHKELEFYRWEGNLSELQQNVRNKLNQVASTWSQEERDRCLDEMEKSFVCSVDLRRHMFT